MGRARWSASTSSPPCRRLRAAVCPSHRSARPRPSGRVRRRVRPDRGRALRCVRDRVADEPDVGDRTNGVCTIATISAAARGGNSSTSSCAVGSRSRAAHAWASVPDEDVMPEPRTPYGRSCWKSSRSSRACDCATVCRLRAAVRRRSSDRTCPARSAGLLRLPAVPVPAFADPPFSLLHPDDPPKHGRRDRRRHDGPLNVSGRARRRPGRPVRSGWAGPVAGVGPLWNACALSSSSAAGGGRPARDRAAAPRPTGAGDRVVESLGALGPRARRRRCRELFEWADVIPIRPVESRSRAHERRGALGSGIMSVQANTGRS